MGTKSLNILVESTFTTAWGSKTPVRYDNVPYVPADGTQAWVSIELWDGESSQATLGKVGGALRRSHGVVFISVYTATNIGSAVARQYAEDAAAIFRDLQTSEAIFQEPTFSRKGELYFSSKDAGTVTTTSQWFSIQVAIPYIYNEWI